MTMIGATPDTSELTLDLRETAQGLTFPDGGLEVVRTGKIRVLIKRANMQAPVRINVRNGDAIQELRLILKSSMVRVGGSDVWLFFGQLESGHRVTLTILGVQNHTARLQPGY
jgi:hypothetical protein